MLSIVTVIIPLHFAKAPKVPLEGSILRNELLSSVTPEGEVSIRGHHWRHTDPQQRWQVLRVELVKGDVPSVGLPLCSKRRAVPERVLNGLVISTTSMWTSSRGGIPRTAQSSGRPCTATCQIA